MKDNRYLIVGGTSKAGTTSVFNYLAGHPQITPARAKETRFFLDADYPLPSERRFSTHGAAEYDTYFPAGNAQAWRFEATPDYLHSRGTAKNMRDSLGTVRFVFILREPISRLLSWYRFGKAMNELPSDIHFDDFIQRQAARQSYYPEGLPHPALCALQSGRYSVYLKSFVEAFGGDAVRILSYDTLSENPAAFMSSLCEFAGIDASLYANYNFEVFNKGRQVRFPKVHKFYTTFLQQLRSAVRPLAPVRKLFLLLKPGVQRFYTRVNVTEDDSLVMSGETRRLVREYYAHEPEALSELCGYRPAWQVPRQFA